MKTIRVVITGLLLTLLASIGYAWAGTQEQESQNKELSEESVTSTETTPSIEKGADVLLHDMSAYLSAAQGFTFHADVTYDSVVDDSQMIQYGGVADISVLRPDRLRAEYRGDVRQSSTVIDGLTATIHNRALNVYSTTEVPAGLDAAVDHVFDEYGFTVPIADFVYSDPYQALTEFVDSGYLVGLHSVDGTPCYHLAFSQETIDWQIWIEKGPRPLPRKLVITYKDEPGAPQYTARLSRWNLQPKLTNQYFEFKPPNGASEIEFMAVPSDLPADTEEIDQ